jgi:uncharacterized protein YjbI with pentapeptide repeats
MPSLRPDGDERDGKGAPADDAADLRALQVRITAQGILTRHLCTPARVAEPDLVASPNNPFWPGIDLDLTGARLVDWSFERGQVQRATFARAVFVGRTGFADAVFAKEADFDGAVFTHPTEFDNCRFDGPTRFIGARFEGEVSFAASRFGDHAHRRVAAGTVCVERAVNVRSHDCVDLAHHAGGSPTRQRSDQGAEHVSYPGPALG